MRSVALRKDQRIAAVGSGAISPIIDGARPAKPSVRSYQHQRWQHH